MEHNFMLHIMTGGKKSRGASISANFQNGITIPLPPIGVFWDIENVQVPRGKSAGSVVSSIRNRFFQNHREAEFMCVCDINKENKAIIHELNDAQVTVVHIDATCKNAADEKLRQCMRRFVDTHGSPSTILLISDDINFAPDLSDFRHRHQVKIILLHRSNATEALLACANEHYDFFELTEDLPFRSPAKTPNNRPCNVIVTDLPQNCSPAMLKKRLRRISDNCGGKLKSLSGSNAVVSFNNPEAAERAQKRMDKEMICGQRISVNLLNKGAVGWNDCYARRGLFKDTNETCSSSSLSSRDPSPLATRQETFQKDKEKEKKTFVFPTPPILDGSNLPTVLKSPTMNRSPNFYKATANQSSSSSSDNPSIQLFGKNLECLNLINFPTKTAAPNITNGGDRTSQENHIRPFYSAAESGSCNKSVGKVTPFLKQGGVQIPWKSPDCFRMPEASLSRNNQNEASAQRMRFQPIRNSNLLAGQSFGFGFRNSELSNHSCDANALNSSNCYQWHNQPLPASVLNSSAAMYNESSAVELAITNLDPAIEVNEMKNILQSLFREHVMVLHVRIIYQTGGNPKAVIKVPSFQDAQLAIANLQRRRIGRRRILISHVSNDKSPPLQILKSEVVSLLKDIPIKRLPFFKFRELYESRYHRAISMSDVYKIRDVVEIQEDSTGRIVCLNYDARNTSSPTDSESSQELPVPEKPYCVLHFQPPQYQGWAEEDSLPPLPDVVISLHTLTVAVHTLLDTHRGSLPLISFCACYRADIGPLPVASSQVSSSVASTNSTIGDSGTCPRPQPKGVPMEHLISCIAGVEIVKSNVNLKKVQWSENRNSTQIRSISPALAGPLNTFGREVIELLKNQPRSMVLFRKFIPAYYRHFAKQCRVSDYGFTKLIDLLEALPHIIQVLGEGQNRLVTLTHCAQVKRFVNELMTILKSYSSKQLTLPELPAAYEQYLEKPFIIYNYGVCFIEDLLIEVPENTVVVSTGGDEKIVSLPKREQTPAEAERVKKFAEEAVELLKHKLTCSMGFDKFIPSYHHHYGKQCRVSDYGFTKLIELLEATNVVEITGTGEDKVLTLIEEERNKVIADRLTAVLRAQPNNMIALHMLGPAYIEMHGHVLQPADYGAVDMPDLLRKLTTSLRIVEGYAGSIVTVVDKAFIDQASLRTRRILMEQPHGELPLSELNRLYQKRYGHIIDLSVFKHDLKDVVRVEETNTLKLMPLQLLARDMMILLEANNNQIPFNEFETAFQDRFKVPIQPSNYGFVSLNSLLSSLSEYFTIKGRRQKRTVSINTEVSGTPLHQSQKLKSESGSSAAKLYEERSNATTATTSTSSTKSGSFCASFLTCFPQMTTWSPGMTESNSNQDNSLLKVFQRKEENPRNCTPLNAFLDTSFKPFVQPVIATVCSEDPKTFLQPYSNLIANQATLAAYYHSMPICNQQNALNFSSPSMQAFLRQLPSSSNMRQCFLGVGDSKTSPLGSNRRASDMSTQTTKGPTDAKESSPSSSKTDDQNVSPSCSSKKAIKSRIAANFTIPLSE